MAFKVLDMRLSQLSNTDTGILPIEDTPILIGDVGLITTAIAGTAQAGDVRVWLSGTVGVSLGSAEEPNILVSIERNGTETFGSGTLIYTESFLTVFSNDLPISITATDFPPATDVNASQIRYTLFISSSAASGNTLIGPATFNGIAAVGAGPF
ncbi:hypothetical protein NQ117_09205 [Paenibacillus sp. SC116]|uniref:hypothetical protein n=1 Tax=Paenibacillus sp. SC116 TaxID=2968986 RepID=UPI00215B3E8F|nr:hypothetical protein [Paenibacillus sp. SC116]MCR8843865.1 hypothetical protein [Paenibacillus sp. SC116]